jgi:uncharacterized membrane protein
LVRFGRFAVKSSAIRPCRVEANLDWTAGHVHNAERVRVGSWGLERQVALGKKTQALGPRRLMAEFLSTPLASIVFLLALTATLIAIGIYVISKVRAGAREDDLKSSELLTNFQELHEQGELDDKEFRKIKSMLAARLQQELKQNDKTH